jgi:abortive infection bacteriophage resistance protein
VATLKKFRDYSEQIKLLESRGMLIRDEARVEKILEFNNYYRLSAYWYPYRIMAKGERIDKFNPNTSFDDVYKLYQFDCNLRQSCFQVLSRIEISLKSIIGYEIGKIDPLAHLDLLKLNPDASAKVRDWHFYFLKRFDKHLQDSKNEDCVIHHNKKYGGKIPVWGAVEIMDWGSLSRLFTCCSSDIKQSVIGHYDDELTIGLFESWISSLNYFRNLCAHESRIWNRFIKTKPKVPNYELLTTFGDFAPLKLDYTKIFLLLSIVQFFIRIVDKKQSNVITNQLSSFPTDIGLSLSMAGFPENWQSLKLWRG